ncbi:hypothetical protein WICMUC_002688 [Wickerhamomyces mucosus]|uniref:Uncharacterized protein n=1 Tax=Wickerhamomyces mucosus TaxID=1378264 RepID=A0A9P8PNR1_9ASCO|nr:hypothetical protein WICMUC_002688 [Wickerhamomyces mucosus]
MLQLPSSFFQATQLTSNVSPDHTLRQIISKRLSIQSMDTQSNISVKITTLEVYLNSIFKILVSENKVKTYLQVLEYGDSVTLSENIPWKLPITKSLSLKWTLQNEIVMTIINIIICYSLRSNELLTSLVASNDYRNEAKFLNIFKISKKALIYINYLKKQQLRSDAIVEVSSDFVDFIEISINISIQSIFLIKTLLILSNAEFDID